MSRRPPTRRERTLHTWAGIVILIAGGTGWMVGGAITNWFAGAGWTGPYPHIRLSVFSAGAEKPPLWTVMQAPADRTWWIIWGVAIAGAIIAVVARPIIRAANVDERARARGQWSEVRRHVSARSARRAGRFTRPDLAGRNRAHSWWIRRQQPITAFGYVLGEHTDGGQLVASFEQRVRVIARTGWGKTARLLTKIARDVPGAALIGTTKDDLFRETVRARQATGRPVWVLDFSDPANRYAAGFDRLSWDFIDGCEEVSLAYRRARGLVAGTEDGDRTDAQDGFFRDAAMQVIAAWLHAAALGGRSVEDIIRWQRNISLTEPHDIIDRHTAAEQATRIALLKHLDDRAERTTSSVERFVANAMFPFATKEGAAFARDGGVSLDSLIRDGATVYLLASPTTAASVSPLLTLFADEWLQTAREVAISSPGSRLPVPAVAVLDELRGLVPIASLPQVAYEMRSYGVGLVYGLQNAAQEKELYGDAAETLAQNVQVTMVGGYDASIAEELTEQAGLARVTTVNVSGNIGNRQYSDSHEWRDAISAADQQTLADGQSVVRVLGCKLFMARSKSYRDFRPLRRQIGRESASVAAEVAQARAVRADVRATEYARAQAAYEAGTRR